MPGVGRLTAMTFLTELERIDRFENRDALCNYIGLVPDISSSDETVHVGDMTKRGNTRPRTEGRTRRKKNVVGKTRPHSSHFSIERQFPPLHGGVMPFILA